MTAIGANTITSIARHFIMPQITDQIYGSNVLLYRLMKGNKRMVQGGTQIEVPLMYKRFTTGGAYSGYDVFDTTPHDTIRNAVFNWKQHQVTWSVDGLTMLKADSPLAIANFLTLQSQQAYMEMAENLATGLFGDGIGTVTGTKDLDGLAGLVGSGSSIGNQSYGGLDRTTYTWWNSSVTGISSTDAMDEATLMTAFTAAQRGGQSPTLIVSGQDQWNRYWALGAASGSADRFPRQPQGHDDLLYSAGFTNLLFNNVPWVADSHVTEGVVSSSNSRVYMLNENFLHWIVSPRADFYLKPFQEPHNQDAMVASLLWAGNLVCSNADAQGGVFNFNS
jgi:hypothetical protein